MTLFIGTVGMAAPRKCSTMMSLERTRFIQLFLCFERSAGRSSPRPAKLAGLVLQHADQPIVEAADLQHGHEWLAVAYPLPGELLEEIIDLVWRRRHLACLHDIALFVAVSVAAIRA